MYGVLDRLEDAGWVEGAWEEQAPDVNRPRRRLYWLTGEGAVRASALLAERRPGSVPGVLRSPPRLLLQSLYAGRDCLRHHLRPADQRVQRCRSLARPGAGRVVGSPAVRGQGTPGLDVRSRQIGHAADRWLACQRVMAEFSSQN
ncbi:PadR family transcriptional regulator [Microbispora sp. KK1-11]|uniref:PadR family transcriptional regulator n=1 Tax=Microbispora sp. KK1-11 TaxID=2053005 RepID=UPI00163BDC4E